MMRNGTQRENLPRQERAGRCRRLLRVPVSRGRGKLHATQTLPGGLACSHLGRGLATRSPTSNFVFLSLLCVCHSCAVVCLIRADAGRLGAPPQPRRPDCSPPVLAGCAAASSSKVGNLLLWAVRCGNETAVRRIAGANERMLYSEAFTPSCRQLSRFKNIIACASSNADVNQPTRRGTRR